MPADPEGQVVAVGSTGTAVGAAMPAGRQSTTPEPDGSGIGEDPAGHAAVGAAAAPKIGKQTPFGMP
jgi:hypothetical protein